MKRVLIFIFLGILLISLITAISITGSAVNNESQTKAGSENSNLNNTDNIQTQNSEEQEQQTQNKDEKTANRIKIKEQNRLKIQAGECPENCTCTGSVTKCELEGGREMTVRAGNSGNIIMQVKGINMTTKVALYQSEGKVYGVFKGNATREIKTMPDQVKEKIQEKLMLKDCDCDVELDEDGNYQAQTKKRARLFGFIPVREKVRVEMNSETGKVTRIRNSWWGFLAKDVKENIVGGCGTVTPGQNDACCQTKGYDVWNSEKGECLFNESE